MSVFALGLNHTTAPLDLRGRFAFTPQQLRAALAGLPRSASTGCQRGRDRLHLQPHRALRRRATPRAGGPGASTGWPASAASPSQTLRSHAYVLEDAPAARHAFRVASGLDSMVLGEPQILGQMKQAVREADDAGTLGTHAAPAVPALVRGRQGSAHLDRDRRALHQHGRRRGAAGVAAVRRPAPRSGCCSSARAR